MIKLAVIIAGLVALGVGQVKAQQQEQTRVPESGIERGEASFNQAFEWTLRVEIELIITGKRTVWACLGSGKPPNCARYWQPPAWIGTCDPWTAQHAENWFTYGPCNSLGIPFTYTYWISMPAPLPPLQVKSVRVTPKLVNADNCYWQFLARRVISVPGCPVYLTQ